MSRWFRHYAGMMRDDKLVSAAIRSKQSVERVVWVWGAVLESAAEIDDGGRYEIDPAEIAYFLRADLADVEAVVAALELAGRVSENAVVKWGDRQFQSDRSAERQRKHRAKKREGHDDTGEGDEGVTSPSRHRDAPETETETEEDTVANATDAAASSPIDLKAAIFASGVPLLQRTGTTDRNARSMLGRWRKDHGDGAVMDALAFAQTVSPSEAIPYITRTLENRSGRQSHQTNGLRGSRPDPSLDFLRQANADFEAERGGSTDNWGTRPALPAIRPG